MTQKNWNIITAILAVAVIALAIIQFMPKQKINNENGLTIAYVIADSINKNYNYIAEMQAELKDEADNAEEIMQRKLSKIEKRFQVLQKEVKYMTPSQKKEAQAELNGMEQNAQILRNELANDLAMKEAELQELFYQHVDEFLEDYIEENGIDYVLSYTLGGQILATNNALNITEEVLKGLNEEHRQKKATETKESK